jgi:hypothetical protein
VGTSITYRKREPAPYCEDTGQAQTTRKGWFVAVAGGSDDATLATVRDAIRYSTWRGGMLNPPCNTKLGPDSIAWWRCAGGDGSVP